MEICKHYVAKINFWVYPKKCGERKNTVGRRCFRVQFVDLIFIRES